MAIENNIRPKPSTPPKPIQRKKSPLRFAEQKKTNWIGLIGFWVFVIFAIVLTIWLFNQSPRLRPLECDNSAGMGSLTSFGHCHERDE